MDAIKYVPFYFNRFTDGVRGYSIEFIGAYIMLLSKQCEVIRITDSVEKLSRWMGGVNTDLIQEVLNEKFIKDDIGYYNEVMQSVINEVVGKSQSASKSAHSRWEKYREQCERNANALQTQSDGNAKKGKEKKVKEKKTNKNKGSMIPPTLEEVELFFVEKGFTKQEAKKAFEYYASADWHDSKGNPVINWKQKMISVWMKTDDKKLKPTSKPIMQNGNFGKL